MAENIGQSLGVEGAGELVRAADGTEWHLSPLSKRIKARFEKWLRSRARDVNECKGHLPYDEYIDLLARIEENICLDRYSWGSPNCVASLNSPAGVTEITRQLLELHHAKERLTSEAVSELLTNNREAFTTALQAILGPPPNAETPASPVTPANR